MLRCGKQHRQVEDWTSVLEDFVGQQCSDIDEALRRIGGRGPAAEWVVAGYRSCLSEYPGGCRITSLRMFSRWGFVPSAKLGSLARKDNVFPESITGLWYRLRPVISDLCGIPKL